MQYPLNEKIGEPNLLVGREKEFKSFDKWLANIPKSLSKSRVIIARRKSGKTAFVQRIFNKLWSENGAIIPFYFDFGENKTWYPDLAIKYYRAFASQYISFLERQINLINKPLSLQEIKDYGIAKSIKPLIDDVDFMLENKDLGGSHGLMWDTACEAPHRYASVLDTKFLVILDEFQYITQYIYPDQHYKTAPIDTLAGSYHSLSESKIAPMLVTGSYANLLLNIMKKYLEAGRLKQVRFSPYLTEDEGLQAVYKYAELYGEPITNDTALQINELCLADPFFISCVIISDYDEKDLTTSDGVINTVNYEICSNTAEMFLNWAEYIEETISQVNDKNAKNILLYLSKNNDSYFTPKDLKEKLGLDLEINEIHKQLIILKEADLINKAASNIHFRGLQDGTLNLILRKNFEEEIKDFAPDFKHEFADKIAELNTKNRKLQGKLNSKWHFAMLNDKKRNQAIENAILDLNLNNKIVFEIGTGSGLFSILFARCGAAHVYTCEQNPIMASIASKLIKNSGYSNAISLIAESSSTLVDKKNFNIKPDIIFTETLDCGIIGEGFEEIKKDIIKIANDNTEILPNNINKLGVLINSNAIVNLNKVDSYSQIDVSYLNQYSTTTYFPVRSEIHQSEWLSESTLIRKYDYASIESSKSVFSITATKNGICHGILSWFEVEFGKHGITTQPNSGSHWHQAFHPFEKIIHITKGNTYDFVLNNKGAIEEIC